MELSANESEIMGQSNNTVLKLLIALPLIGVASYYLSEKNYLLFHTLVELFSIVIAFTITTVSVYSFRVTKDKLVVMMGIAYFFVGGFDLLHTLAFKGMGVFSGNTANLATQLWIIARYIEALSILAIPFLLSKKVRYHYLLTTYILISSILLITLFHWDVFPTCAIPGQGLTPFKIVSEYIISGIFVFALFALKNRKHLIENQVYKYLVLAYSTTIVTELCFTLYVDPYGLFNMLGHILKIISFYFIYQAVVKTSILLPYMKLELALEVLKQEMEQRKREEEIRIKMEEEMLRASKLDSIATLAGGIAHDFNNLLTIISGQASLITAFADNPDRVKRGNSEILKAAGQATSLTQQLLTFSKGGEPIKETAIISEIIEESLGLALSGSNVRADFYYSPELKLVDVDIGQFKQVINNLVINASQAMPDGGTIKVSAENVLGTQREHNSHLTEGEYVKITIEDEGVGISPENLKKIFDPFFTTKNKGHGLGLASCFSIIKKHKGLMSVESKEGVGTTFYIYLPASQMKLKKRDPNLSRSISRKIGGKILVMDDEVAIRAIVSDMLIELGYQVDYAENGQEALGKYMEAASVNEPYETVILDLTIRGGMGGVETAEKILQDNTETNIILTSGYSDENLSIFPNPKIKYFLKKPYTYGDLAEVLNLVFNEQPIDNTENVNVEEKEIG